MTVGAPACGMNSAIYAFVRMALFAGHRVMAIHDGFIGLADGKVSISDSEQSVTIRTDRQTDNQTDRQRDGQTSRQTRN